MYIGQLTKPSVFLRPTKDHLEQKSWNHGLFPRAWILRRFLGGDRSREWERLTEAVTDKTADVLPY